MEWSYPYNTNSGVAVDDDLALFRPDAWFRAGRGPRYEQLYRHLAATIGAGELAPETQLPPERELALIANVSRVTVRKAVSQLVEDGVLEQRRGAGTFVRPARPKLEQSLSALVSFTEYMRQRGKTSSSRILRRGLFLPTPDEMMALGLSAADRVARVERLRFADDTPLALEWSSLPTDVLPDPEAVETSLYDVLRDLYDPYPPLHEQLQWITGTKSDAEARAYLADFNLKGKLAGVKCPMLVTHGARDHMVPASSAEQLFNELPVADKTLRIFDDEIGGSGHCSVDNWTQVVAYQIDWVLDKLG